MGISYSLRGERPPSASQRCEIPAVYLDHWALSHFSEFTPDASRFVRALKRAGGTLVLSYYNFVEFVVAPEAEHSLRAERFLDSVLPNIYFADSTLERTVENERRFPGALEPPEDRIILPLICLNPLSNLTGLSFKGIIKEMASSPALGVAFAHAKSALVAMIDERRSNSIVVQQAQAFQAPPNAAKTEIYFLELQRRFVIDAHRKFDEHDSIDLHHALLASAYCNLALLDGPWVAIVEEMRKRLRKANFPHMPARVWSGRKNGLHSFIGALEAWRS
jgi:hypothetical protein